MKNANLTVVLVVLGGFILAAILTINNRSASSATSAPEGSSVSADSNPFLSVFSEPTDRAEGSTNKSWAESALSVVFRLFLAVVLSGVLAFRPRKEIHLFKRSLFVSQTQILLAVVAAALMMIVGDNAARAFAIFAAVSLVRFRTNIRDPKEITVLLISLSLGLAAGVGRWDLGIALCLFALALLWLLEYNESEQVYRSMELTVKTRDSDKTQAMLKKVFRKHKIEAEVREIDPPDDKNPVGSIVYYLNLRLNLSTDYLSDRVLNLDSENIEGIQWSQKKSATDIYQ